MASVQIICVDVVPVGVVPVGVVPVDVVPIDIVRVDVVAINVVEIGVVKVRVIDISVVVVITVCESIRIRNVGIVVVHDRGVVPATSPGVVTPSAASTTAADRRTDGYAEPKRKKAGATISPDE